MSTVILILAVACVLSLIPILFVYFRDRRRDSGERVITCPETRTAEVVRVDAGHAAWTDLVGDKKLRLQSCSRWPEKADCGQDCLAQVESAPDGCLVRERLTAWYQDAKCVLCGMPIGPVRWIDNRPGLRSSDERVLFWEDVPARAAPLPRPGWSWPCPAGPAPPAASRRSLGLGVACAYGPGLIVCGFCVC